MPRYFFDIRDGVDVRDVGQELADEEAAREEAVNLAARYAQDTGTLSHGGVIVVSARGEAGPIIATVRLVCQVELGV